MFVLRKLKRVPRVDVFETKILAFAHAERLGDFFGSLDNFFCFHKTLDGWWRAISSFARRVSLTDKLGEFLVNIERVVIS
jgi:hypothetical protein